MKTRTRILILLIPILLVAAVILRLILSDPAADTRRQAATQVRVAPPQRQTLVQSLQLTGDILPIQQAQVFAKVYGNLESVAANMGDYVRAHQLLARVDTTELAQQDRQTAATYQNALVVYERDTLLRAQNFISAQEFDDAETAMRVAKENYDAAQTRLGYADIVAPFSGFITQRFLDPGALLSAGSATLFTIMDLDVMKIMVPVLEKDVPTVSIGTKAVITVEAYPGREFSGTVTRLSEALDLATRTMPVEIDIPNKDYSLKPGMFAAVSIVIGARPNALTVPTQAVLKDGKGYYVYVADNGVARRVDVTVGIEQQSRTEIVSGLGDTASVITTGQQYVRDGGRVTVQP